MPATLQTCAIICLLAGLPTAFFSLPSVAQEANERTGRFTIAAEQITLQKLVQKLSAQSGLILDVDPADPQSSTLLTAYLTDVSPKTTADALVRLLSARRAAWRWEKRDAKQGDDPVVLPKDFKPNVPYRLRPTSGAKVYAAQTRSRILQGLASTISTTGSDNPTAPTSSDLAGIQARFQKVRAEMPILPSDGALTEKQLYSYTAWSNKRQDLSRQLAQIVLMRLSPADRQQLTEGNALRIPSRRMDTALASITGEAAEALSGDSKHFGPGPDGTLVELFPTQPPSYALALTTRRDPFAVAPLLTVAVERRTVYKMANRSSGSVNMPTLDSIGATAEETWRRILIKEWIPDASPSASLPPDSTLLNDLAQRPNTSPMAQRRPTTAFSAPLVRLSQTATKSSKPINILARLATFKGGTSDPFADQDVKTLGEARRALLKERAMPTQWFAGTDSTDAVLLANALPAIWTSGPDKLIAPKTLTDFNSLRRRDPNGFITFDALCNLARRLSADALDILLHAEDDTSENAKEGTKLPVQTSLAEFTHRYYPLLSYLGNIPNLQQQIQSADGVSLSDPANAGLQRAWLACTSRPGAEHPMDDDDSPTEQPTKTNSVEIVRISTTDRSDELVASRGVVGSKIPVRFFTIRYDSGDQSYSQFGMQFGLE